MNPFEQRLPWLGGDLQTLRDTFRAVDLPADSGEEILIDVPAMPSGAAGAGQLLAMLDRPATQQSTSGLVVLLHGLGGSSRREGLRRMAITLQQAGFAVLRLNLRGADPG
ncbi:MAG: alpha/beta hydrolase, partial [Prochlorococcus sp.]|nr:alpha/beta hydrolase [Prochlorococcus sp.]